MMLLTAFGYDYYVALDALMTTNRRGGWEWERGNQHKTGQLNDDLYSGKDSKCQVTTDFVGAMRLGGLVVVLGV